eukprot:CAMPEP_0203665378 /NCGR_PEP_ID=MMETSP0090-20130426/2593_1 /ASSEMBLY_ACC=CAM_ASM_001088 /TAXON_ID=426623 /ORGANISM="Chaetoceros affinis, Strain CCMP159" /LENGTH=826 /DNA_ID=CAMNT_0050528899 /DNA_START=169 /DNA_END=2646 /DNA_ORIENTATION=-
MSCPYALSLTTNASTGTDTNIKYDVDDNDNDNDEKTSTENHDDDDHHHHSSPIPSLPQVLNLNNLDKLDNDNSGNNMTMTPMQALQLAKSSCPAFQSSCPFRNVQDAHSMKKALESLPKSHLEIAAIDTIADTTATDASSASSAANAANNGVGKGGKGGKGGNSTSGIHFEFEKDKDHSKKGHAEITSTTTESNSNSNSNNMTEHGNSKSNGRMSIGINQTLRVALQHVHNVSQSLRSGSELGSGSGSSVSMSMSAKAKTEAKTPTTTGSNKDPNSELEPFLPHTDTNTPTHTHTDHNNNTNNNTTVKPSTTQGRSRSNSFMESHRKFELAGGICPYKTLNPNYKSSGSGNGSAGGSGSSSNAVKFVNAMEELSFNAILAQLIDKQDTIASVTLPSTSTSAANSTANSASTSATTIPTTTKTQSQLASTSTSTLRKSRSSNSLSTALKIGTAASHSSAESVHFVKEFIKGNIQLPLYIKLLSNLYWVYKTLECELDKFAPTSFPTLHKVELYRMESLQDDLEFFCTGLDFDVDVDNDENANANAEIERKIPPSQATKDYMHRIEYIAKVEPLLLLSHAYTRYLGDLSGGKVLARVAKRALNLGGSKSSEEGKGTDKGSSTSTVCDGLSFYHFSKIASAKIFKDEYRQSLDNLDFLTVEQIERLVAEANVAFVLNMRIFEELDVLDGVKGAAVRDYGEATSYYEECIKEQEMRKEAGEDGGDDEGSDGDYDRGHAALFGEMGMEGVECPFAKLGGPNPHKKKVEEEGSGGDGDGDGRRTGKTLEVDAHRHKGDGRCPWPFVFFHDPKTGMQDWQTWLVIGLVLCWAW